MKNLIQIAFLLIVFVPACTNDIDTNVEHQASDIVGTWIHIRTDNVSKTSVYTRSDTFDFGKTGYSFAPDSSCTLRLKVKCGDPPVLDNIEGSYTKTEDKLNIKYFRGRKNEIKLFINRITRDSLTVTRIY